MKTVAICGFASTTRDGVRRSTADEIWSLNWVYNYDFLPRIDRLFEMHPIWWQAKNTKPAYEKPRKHWQWLQEQHPFPIYMLEHRPEVPACVVYPIEKVSFDLFGAKWYYQLFDFRKFSFDWWMKILHRRKKGGLLLRGRNPMRLFGSSVDYMLALAIHEGFERIELYGVEMGSMTEYQYQRESLMLFAGIGMGRGCTIAIPEGSILFNKNKLYGYEGGQMIFRQDLERLKNEAAQMHENEKAILQFKEGVLSKRDRSRNVL